MRTELFELVGRETQKWTATFQRAKYEDDYDGNTHICKPCLQDLTTIDGHYYTQHAWITPTDEETIKIIPTLKSYQHVFFEGYVVKYMRANKTIDYGIEGVKNFIIYDPSNIVKNDFEQSVKNLHAASHSQKEIALLLNVSIGKIQKCFTKDVELKKTITNTDLSITTGIRNFIKRGKTLEEIAKIFNRDIETIKRYL